MRWLLRFTYNRFISLNKMNYKHPKVARGGNLPAARRAALTRWVLQDNERDAAGFSFPLGQRSAPSPSVSPPSKRRRYALPKKPQIKGVSPAILKLVATLFSPLLIYIPSKRWSKIIAFPRARKSRKFLTFNSTLFRG